MSWLSFGQVLCCWNHPWSTVSSFQRNCLQVNCSLSDLISQPSSFKRCSWVMWKCHGRKVPTQNPHCEILVLEARGSVCSVLSSGPYSYSCFGSPSPLPATASTLMPRFCFPIICVPPTFILGHLEMLVQWFLLGGRRKLFQHLWKHTTPLYRSTQTTSAALFHEFKISLLHGIISRSAARALRWMWYYTSISSS